MILIVVQSQHPQKLDAISTMMKIVVPYKTNATKGKEIATMIGTAQGIQFAEKTIVMKAWDFHIGVIAARGLATLISMLTQSQNMELPRQYQIGQSLVH